MLASSTAAVVAYKPQIVAAEIAAWIDLMVVFGFLGFVDYCKCCCCR